MNDRGQLCRPPKIIWAIFFIAALALSLETNWLARRGPMALAADKVHTVANPQGTLLLLVIGSVSGGVAMVINYWRATGNDRGQMIDGGLVFALAPIVICAVVTAIVFTEIFTIAPVAVDPYLGLGILFVSCIAALGLYAALSFLSTELIEVSRRGD